MLPAAQSPGLTTAGRAWGALPSLLEFTAGERQRRLHSRRAKVLKLREEHSGVRTRTSGEVEAGAAVALLGQDSLFPESLLWSGLDPRTVPGASLTPAVLGFIRLQ